MDTTSDQTAPTFTVSWRETATRSITLTADELAGLLCVGVAEVNATDPADLAHLGYGLADGLAEADDAEMSNFTREDITVTPA